MGSSCQAVQTLRKLLEAESKTSRLGAARAILDNVVRYREVQELSDRLERIERILETP